MSDLLMFVAGICVIILIFGILKRVILIALIIAGLVAIGAMTFEYTQDDAASSASARDINI